MAISRQPARPAAQVGLLRRPNAQTGLVSWLTTIDHKKLGILYLVSSFVFLGVGTFESFLIRLQLMFPEQKLLNPELYNQMFTMHGVTMVFLAIMPMGIGFANYLVPLQIGARDLAFPRLNALGYWIYLFGALFLYTSWFLGGAPDVGWFAYSPLTSLSNNPGYGTDFYMIGLFIGGLGTLITAMNIIVTIINMRAPGMTLMRMPVFVWMILVTMFLIVFAFPPLTIALFQVIMDRHFGTLFYVPEAGGLPILWQHLFWVFGHPEVYIIILPGFGAISEIIPTFSRKPLSGYPVMVLSGIFIGFMGFAVWSHHMFSTGLGTVANAAFSLTTIVIGIPTGAKIFNWVLTMWGGKIHFSTAMKFAIAFLITFTMGGITGIMLALPPFTLVVTDSYFVVAHFHYVMGGGALLAFFGAVYYWFPKFTGKLLSEKIGNWVFWLVAGGLHTIFLPQHFAGLMGMPRRTQYYAAGMGLEIWNLISTIGVFIAVAGALLFLYDFFRSLRNGTPAGNDPWGGRTLEWSITSPPPVHNFDVQPTVIDRDDFWLQKHPEFAHNEAAREDGAKYDEHGVHMPGQSWYPFVMSLGIFIGGYGLLYGNWVLGILHILLIFASAYGWALEGIGGKSIYPKGKQIVKGDHA
jgi:cytochrome c oxidase subunit I